MKRSILMLLLSLLTVTVCFSENTYPIINNDSLIVITPQQLKSANLVFIDRDRLLEVNSELEEQIDMYESICASYEESDSVKSMQINLLLEDSKKCYETISKQASKINRLNKCISIGGVTIGISLMLLLICR